MRYMPSCELKPRDDCCWRLGCILLKMPAIIVRTGANFRMPYRPTPALLDRLTPQQREVVSPLNFNLLAREPQRKPDAEIGVEAEGSTERLSNGRVKGWV